MWISTRPGPNRHGHKAKAGQNGCRQDSMPYERGFTVRHAMVAIEVKRA